MVMVAEEMGRRRTFCLKAWASLREALQTYRTSGHPPPPPPPRTQISQIMRIRGSLKKLAAQAVVGDHLRKLTVLTHLTWPFPQDLWLLLPGSLKRLLLSLPHFLWASTDFLPRPPPLALAPSPPLHIYYLFFQTLRKKCSFLSPKVLLPLPP